MDDAYGRVQFTVGSVTPGPVVPGAIRKKAEQGTREKAVSSTLL